MHATPLHGGNLQQAVERYRIPRSDWLDLSTGISPFVWPVPALPIDVWQRLPEADGQLEQAAHDYYGAAALPVPGSQWAIQQLPALFTKTRVWLAQESYEEHRHWWQHHGYRIHTFTKLPDATELQDRDIVIVINPNNPTALTHSAEQLLALAQQLQRKNGWLIVDEAFIDPTPEHSLITRITPEQNVIVLRSMGKFFGLAGIRTGFVLGNATLQAALQARLGPWAISHPAQHIAIRALRDTQWQHTNRQRLQQHSAQVQACLQTRFTQDVITSTPLFVSVKLHQHRADDWQHALAQQGIWIRSFPQWNRIRIGLPGHDHLKRLTQAIVHTAMIENA